MKRLVDIVVSMTALLVLAPLMLAAAIAVVAESGAPVFFRQMRVGLGGREFGMYKFRSMVKDAAAIGSWQTTSGDPRITTVGRFLRRTSIDELPQLINVFNGDMSLIGPRPDVPAQRVLYRERDWAERGSVRPGITGLAQALLRSDGTHEERLAMDLRYVREHNFRLDLQIALWTLGRLSGKGGN